MAITNEVPAKNGTGLIDRPAFEKVFPVVADDMVDEIKDYGAPEYLTKWWRHSLEHNTLGGKYNRGMSVAHTVSILLGRDLKPDEQFQASLLGWLTELLQAYLLVADDIMDDSLTRRGNPCWYRMPEVGLVAINDAFMLEAAIYQLLKRHFRHLSCYIDLVELFHDVSFKTEVGQQSDLLIAPLDKVDLTAFSLEKYHFMVKYKTAYYSFYLPVALALHLVGLASRENLEQAERILLPLGEYFQVQDDYLDNFGAPEVIGKIGMDIQDNKGSWLINQAILLASPQQRSVLDENYGRKDSDKEAKVKKVFADLELDKVYEKYEDEMVANLREMIRNVDQTQGLKKEVFEAFLNKIYKRSK